MKIIITNLIKDLKREASDNNFKIIKIDQNGIHQTIEKALSSYLIKILR